MSGTLAAWPTGLPQAAEIDGYEETPPDLALRSRMDAGPPKLRRRFSAGETRIAGRLMLRLEQTETLLAFWRDTLAGGSLPFAWTHPRTGAACTMRFVSPPRLRHRAGPLWEAELSLEILP